MRRRAYLEGDGKVNFPPLSRLPTPLTKRSDRTPIKRRETCRLRDRHLGDSTGLQIQRELKPSGSFVVLRAFPVRIIRRNGFDTIVKPRRVLSRIIVSIVSNALCVYRTCPGVAQESCNLRKRFVWKKNCGDADDYEEGA
jgi:hypothetical protein